ncbi:hypothetical protein X011_19490 [Mycobacterium tuberculosis variant microti OV254]|nr:hypothetical protein X011_19490 [Mycobacterium tuberculosis variant microti OV254]
MPIFVLTLIDSSLLVTLVVKATLAATDEAMMKVIQFFCCPDGG